MKDSNGLSPGSVSSGPRSRLASGPWSSWRNRARRRAWSEQVPRLRGQIAPDILQTLEFLKQETFDITMSTPLDSELVRDFLDAFEEVFDRDWTRTKEMLGIPAESDEQKRAAEEMGLETIPIIADDGTFIHPKVEDEVEDWGRRGRLLQAYRALRRFVS